MDFLQEYYAKINMEQKPVEESNRTILLEGIPIQTGTG
jgi:hypothetical protein